MKDLDFNELKTIAGGQILLGGEILKAGIKKGVLFLLGGLAYELVTEGFKECFNDFKEGFESTYKEL